MRDNANGSGYRPQIEALIAKYPHVSAIRVQEEIAKGAGGISRGRWSGAALTPNRTDTCGSAQYFHHTR